MNGHINKWEKKNLIIIQLSDTSVNKESAWNVGDLGSVSGLGRSPGEGKGCLLQYSDLENSMDYTVPMVTNSWTQLTDFHETF